MPLLAKDTQQGEQVACLVSKKFGMRMVWSNEDDLLLWKGRLDESYVLDMTIVCVTWFG